MPGVNSQLEQWFADEIIRLGPDFVAFVQGFTGARGEAGGRAFLGGYLSDNGLRGSSPPVAVFRHEVGHNVGGGHCPGDSNIRGFPYAHGYNNGQRGQRTILCGNSLNMYSNPDILDSQGIPLGDPETADMARVWRERAETMSSHRRRVQHIVVDTTLDQTLEDGLSSLREAVANISAEAQLWSDCSYSPYLQNLITFSDPLSESKLLVSESLAVNSATEILCGHNQMILIAPPEGALFTILKGGSLKVQNCSVEGLYTGEDFGYETPEPKEYSSGDDTSGSHASGSPDSGALSSGEFGFGESGSGESGSGESGSGRSGSSPGDSGS